ncbi:gliding motility lipoprotein GldD [Faecalibacter rhinopitheci]|uniref:Gliding motility lipoprotein GldD n=1 Tax=Faecalibacter rhinopitheci TaxID=2779678 RepID=A0A8J7FV58_9FLAO|nr:gliding motility lipoprotein GldD [Faecalibacter rhinopitheci]MBF0596876.1 gliding motility lipoprotein GldD [Faecalibacter rhinopitheci]MBQ0147631.1 gliding motility lipoprotein GldD [Candidatus Onthonaster equi]
MNNNLQRSILVKKTLCLVALCISAIFFMSCSDQSEAVKPLGQVRLEYPVAEYIEFKEETPYKFEYSNFGKIKKGKQKDWYIINYPKMKANIYLTYFPVNSKQDLILKIKESERFVQDQTVKASFISPQIFEFPEKKVFGTLYELGGNSAINLQFHATDSIHNFVSGSVYFSTEPKADSLAPAIEYIKKDVQQLIETLSWRK